MQIKFHYVKFKNILSYGNVETTFDLSSYRHTIITATNGSGKSSLIDAICYVLYGKPYRSIKLGQLVNSINKKNLLVTIEFSIGNYLYKIIRGQKPTIFEIYKNNELIKEDAASKDYQSYLETQILGINFKTFKQIIVIGSASYVPFMNLTAAERRNITEDVLDISVFSSMQEIAKQKLNEIKSSVDSLTYEITITKTQLESQKELLSQLEYETKEKQEELDKDKKLTEDNIVLLKSKIQVIDDELLKFSDINNNYDKFIDIKNKLNSKLIKFDSMIESMNESIKFYDNDSCPTCGQEINVDLKVSKQKEVGDKIKLLQSEKLNVENTLNVCIEKLNTLEQSIFEQKNLLQNRRDYVYTLSVEQKKLLTFKEVNVTESYDLCKSKVKTLVEQLIEKNESKIKLSKEQSLYKTATEILKDNGIKAKVISTFIPVLNTLINEYLEKFDMYVSFELDETFTETIKSRDRDTFSYNSFSEGEKKRIDLGILFAWRKIAMSRNSVSTNLLIFDETMDSSLDDDSVQTFIDILASIEESVNTIIISHRNVIPELFDRHVTISKIRDFSVMS